MQFITLLICVAVAQACDILRAGIMYISKINGIPVRHNLIVSGEKLVIASEGSRFDFDARGFIKLTGTGEYLSVSRTGQLILVDSPDDGFSVTPQAGSRSQKTLSYNGYAAFKLCEDNSVAVEHHSVGIPGVMITYEDINYER